MGDILTEVKAHVKNRNTNIWLAPCLLFSLRPSGPRSGPGRPTRGTDNIPGGQAHVRAAVCPGGELPI